MSPCRSLHSLRLFLFALGSVTVFFVCVFYGVISGVITTSQYNAFIKEFRREETGNIETEKPLETFNKDHVITSTPLKNVAGGRPVRRNTKNETLKSRHSGQHARLDYRKFDISEKKTCDEQCQRNIQILRHSGISRTCANAPILKRQISIWDGEGNLRDSQRARLNHLFPIDNSRMIYCSVPKDGCSAWKRTLLTVAGHDPDLFPNNVHPMFARKIKPLSAYNVTEAQRRLRTYNKFLFVRDPLDRMLSLFLDKAVSKHDFPFNDTQFEDFLRYMLQKPYNSRSMGYSEHWTHATFLCLPCDVDYTFIGRLETSTRDSEYVFKYLVDPLVSEITHVSMPKKIHRTHSSDPDVKSKYFSQVDRRVLERVYRQYQLDYEMFSYDKPSFLRKKSRSNYKEKLR